MQVLLATCGAWHLRNTARAFESRNALGAMWCTEKNLPPVSPERFKRCWPFHLAMCPFYFWTPQIWIERAFYTFFPIWRAWQAAQERPPHDVIHSVMGYCTEPFDWADKNGALKVLDCPNTHPTTYFGFWQRECDLWCPGEKVPIPRWMFARMNREIDRADVIIVQSRFSRESMVANGVPEEKILVNPMGVDTSVFTERTEVPRKIRFISVGTISLRKGHQYLFRAFEIVKRHLPEAELVCVGQYKADFRKERPRWENSFTRYPSLPHSEVAKLLRSSTAFVFPSQEEGIARAQVEALASGLPVIGTHQGGATTLVEDGREGFIVRQRDPAHIAEAMIRLATDRDTNAAMGRAAHQRAGRNNTWQDYGDRLLQFYASKLESRRKPSDGATAPTETSLARA
jgi:glycosyltransferase involved in cell wall biosynthesis